MSKNQAELFKQLAASRSSSPTDSTTQNSATEKATSKETKVEKKRGRPAIGKRSDPDWIGRTYYIRRNTDLDVEEELHRLKRQNATIDKSELVDFLLSEWVKSQQGKKATFQIGENS